jgi:hypothetical protein
MGICSIGRVVVGGAGAMPIERLMGAVDPAPSSVQIRIEQRFCRQPETHAMKHTTDSLGAQPSASGPTQSHSDPTRQLAGL